MYVCSYSSKNYQKFYVVIAQKINLTFKNKKATYFYGIWCQNGIPFLAPYSAKTEPVLAPYGAKTFLAPYGATWCLMVPKSAKTGHPKITALKNPFLKKGRVADLEFT